MSPAKKSWNRRHISHIQKKIAGARNKVMSINVRIKFEMPQPHQRALHITDGFTCTIIPLMLIMYQTKFLHTYVLTQCLQHSITFVFFMCRHDFWLFREENHMYKACGVSRAQFHIDQDVLWKRTWIHAYEQFHNHVLFCVYAFSWFELKLCFSLWTCSAWDIIIFPYNCKLIFIRNTFLT